MIYRSAKISENTSVILLYVFLVSFRPTHLDSGCLLSWLWDKKVMKRSKESAMFKLVEKWKKNGKRQKQFSGDNNITLSAFSYWNQRYRRSKISNPGFASVTLTPVPEPIYPNPNIYN